MIQTLIVDDEKPARDELRYLLSTQHADAITIVGEASNATETIELVTKFKPQLLFLDIHMRGFNGIEIAKVVHSISPDTYIIFVTAYDSYAMDAFSIHALDYLIKPLDEKRLSECIDHIQPIIERKAAPIEDQCKLAMGLNPPPVKDEDDLPASSSGESMGLPSRIALEKDGRIMLIDIDAIHYITGETGNLEIHAKDGIYTAKKTLNEFQERFKGTPIYRVHRSYLVNLNKVCEVIPWFKGTYWLRLPESAVDNKLVDVPVSKTQVKTIKHMLGIC